MSNEEVPHFFSVSVDVEIKLSKDCEPYVIWSKHEMEILLKGTNDTYYKRVGVGD